MSIDLVVRQAFQDGEQGHEMLKSTYIYVLSESHVRTPTKVINKNWPPLEMVFPRIKRKLKT